MKFRLSFKKALAAATEIPSCSACFVFRGYCRSRHYVFHYRSYNSGSGLL